MEYKKLEEINNKLKTIPVKGKNYVEVNVRVKAFWQICENGMIKTNLVSNENGVAIFKAEVYEDRTDTEPRATGWAYEKEGSTFINKTSYIENCETSAVGRALGNAGFGIDTSIASAEEVMNADEQQDDGNTLINQIMVESLQDLIANIGATKEECLTALKELGANNLRDLKYNQVDEFRKKLGQ